MPTSSEAPGQADTDLCREWLREILCNCGPYGGAFLETGETARGKLLLWLPEAGFKSDSLISIRKLNREEGETLLLDVSNHFYS